MFCVCIASVVLALDQMWRFGVVSVSILSSTMRCLLRPALPLFYRKIIQSTLCHHAPLRAKMVTRGAGTEPSPAAKLLLFVGEPMCGLATELSLPGGGLSHLSTARSLDGFLGSAGSTVSNALVRFFRSRLSRMSHSSITTCVSNYLNDRWVVVLGRKRGKPAQSSITTILS